MRNRLILLLPFFALLIACEPSERVSGQARVIDGDSLEIAGRSIRLFGVDAPERRQECMRDGAVWSCGDAATDRLRQLVSSDSIVCDKRDTDNYGRTVARCMSGDIDLAAELALSGLALAYRQYSFDYIDEETEARESRRGLWAGEFQEPWDYRRSPQPVMGRLQSSEPQSKSPPAATSPSIVADCTIKGNINSRGERIYHVPGSPSWEQTVIDESRGERWFCSEQEAIAAGWRAPRG